MEKNYYEILQIDKNASPEIVEKAYKTLVKMYHPDLQEEGNKQEYEEKLKLINEAYEVLFDEERRKKYDLELEKENNINNQNINLNNNNVQNEYQDYEQTVYQDINEKVKQARQQAEHEKQYNEQINNAVNKAYHDAYIQDLKNRGYKIKYKKTFRDYMLNLISLIITILILFLLWQIPFIKNIFINIYKENDIIHHLVDFLFNLFNN